MYVLTVRQPWAWAIFHAGKDVENRSYATRYRGRIGVHAARRVDHEALAELTGAGFKVPDDLPVGMIVGTVEIDGCTRKSQSRWARPGAWHWGLVGGVPLEPAIPHLGRRRMHDVPALDSLIKI